MLFWWQNRGWSCLIHIILTASFIYLRPFFLGGMFYFCCKTRGFLPFTHNPRCQICSPLSGRPFLVGFLHGSNFRLPRLNPIQVQNAVFRKPGTKNLCMLDLPPTQDSSGKWRFRLGFPTKNVIILVVTVTVRGPHSIYMGVSKKRGKPPKSSICS